MYTSIASGNCSCDHHTALIVQECERCIFTCELLPGFGGELLDSFQVFTHEVNRVRKLLPTHL